MFKSLMIFIPMQFGFIVLESFFIIILFSGEGYL